jgi:hypothetical protein
MSVAFAEMGSSDTIRSRSPSRYQEAVERRNSIATPGKRRGRPFSPAVTPGKLVEHPYVKMLREHDLLVDRLGAVIRKRHRGPQPSEVVTPSPAAKLRAVQ